jgi:hypothetical protein
MECERNGWNDENLPPDIAFISIVGSKECQEYYLGEEETHYFSQSHPTVLNLAFDDIPKDQVEWKGHVFYGLSEEQAEEIVEFVKNKDDIHLEDDLIYGSAAYRRYLTGISFALMYADICSAVKSGETTEGGSVR